MSDVDTNNLFFIYGTLKKSGNNHHIIERFAHFRGEVQTVFKYPMYDIGDGFPYLQDSRCDGNLVIGELYEIPEKYHDRLDYFEGVPTLYKKGLIEVLTKDAEMYMVNAYFVSNEIDFTKLKLIKEWHV